MNKMLFGIAGLMIVLAVACAGSTPVRTPTTGSPVPTATIVATVSTATDGPRLSTPTPKVSQEWELQEISVEGNEVTVTLLVHAGIDVDVTVGGATPSRVNAEIPVIKFVFENVAAGEHPVVISDEVGFNERASVTVKAAGQLPNWLAEWLIDLDSGKVEFEPVSITKYQYQGQTVYYVVQQCCDQFTDLLDAGGKLIGHPDGGITGKGDGITQFSPAGLEGETIWQQR